MIQQGKRGVVEVQFNWIFIMIAGGLILFFFMTIISYQQQLSKNKLGVELASQLELIFSGRGVSPGAKQPIDIADIPIKFDCSEYLVMDQRIASGNVLIFAPAEVVTKKLMTITMSFDLPMRTNNMIMMTSPAIKYYFVNFGQAQSGSVSERIEQLLDFPLAPEGEKIDFKFVSVEELGAETYQNNPFIRFIVHDNDPAVPLSLALPASFDAVGDETISAVVVNENMIGDEENLQTSQLFFYQKNGGVWQSTGSSFTLGFSSFTGAVFAKDGDTFSCLMSRALRRATFVVGVSTDRAKQLQQAFTPEPGVVVPPEMLQCSVIAAEGAGTLQQIDAALVATPEGIISINDVDAFTELLKQLAKTNEEAALNTCPSLY